jgi:hypothetical protein
VGMDFALGLVSLDKGELSETTKLRHGRKVGRMLGRSTDSSDFFIYIFYSFCKIILRDCNGAGTRRVEHTHARPDMGSG